MGGSHLAQINPHRVAGAIGDSRSHLEVDVVWVDEVFQTGIGYGVNIFEQIKAKGANYFYKFVIVIGLLLVLNQGISPFLIRCDCRM